MPHFHCSGFSEVIPLCIVKSWQCCKKCSKLCCVCFGFNISWCERFWKGKYLDSRNMCIVLAVLIIFRGLTLKRPYYSLSWFCSLFLTLLQHPSSQSVCNPLFSSCLCGAPPSKSATCSDWLDGPVCCDWLTSSSVFGNCHDPYHNRKF